MARTFGWMSLPVVRRHFGYRSNIKTGFPELLERIGIVTGVVHGNEATKVSAVFGLCMVCFWLLYWHLAINTRRLVYWL
jgi:hypothetical protein